MTNEFKDALGWINNQTEVLFIKCPHCGGDGSYVQSNYHTGEPELVQCGGCLAVGYSPLDKACITLTIRRALLIADKLMDEPSDGMYASGRDEAEASGRVIAVFKSMRDQMLREVGE